MVSLESSCNKLHVGTKLPFKNHLKTKKCKSWLWPVIFLYFNNKFWVHLKINKESGKSIFQKIYGNYSCFHHLNCFQNLTRLTRDGSTLTSLKDEFQLGSYLVWHRGHQYEFTDWWHDQIKIAIFKIQTKIAI